MKEFPDFMKNSANQIDKKSQHTDALEGYVFNGADGSQMVFWTCYQDSDFKKHAHNFDVYFVVVQGQYTVTMDGKETPIGAGQECHIPNGTPHSGSVIAGTRTINCFGGKRV